MKVKLLEDFNWNVNDVSYDKGQVVEVVKLREFSETYADYSHGGINWIPKYLVKDVK